MFERERILKGVLMLKVLYQESNTYVKLGSRNKKDEFVYGRLYIHEKVSCTLRYDLFILMPISIEFLVLFTEGKQPQNAAAFPLNNIGSFQLNLTNKTTNNHIEHKASYMGGIHTTHSIT